MSSPPRAAGTAVASFLAGRALLTALAAPGETTLLDAVQRQHDHGQRPACAGTRSTSWSHRSRPVLVSLGLAWVMQGGCSALRRSEDDRLGGRPRPGSARPPGARPRPAATRA